MQYNKDVVTSINFVITLSKDREGGGMKYECAGMQNIKHGLAVICFFSCCDSFLMWLRMDEILQLLAQGFMPYVDFICKDV